jgi:hypothetical protein
MVTMVDEIFDREYQASRKQLHASMSNGLDRLSQTISSAFEVLVKIEYDAPWTAKSKRASCN